MPVRVPDSAAEPLDSAAFAATLDPLGPFEPSPHLAIGVSGGADSLTLALLAAEWAAARGGAATGLVVDHAMRPESRAEAAGVAAQLAAAGIAAAVLPWTRPPGAAHPSLAAARAARAALLEAWCAAHGVLHLLLAHHRDDQAETVLLRLAAGSGPDGLAGMPAIDERTHVRVLRPLLSVPKARLQATLRARDVAWVEDPTNANPAYARPRLRAAQAALAREGLTAARLARSAGKQARLRAAAERATAGLLAAAARVEAAAAGSAGERLRVALRPEPLRAADPEIRRRALALVLAAVGGDERPAGEEGLARLAAALAAGLPRPMTLGHCRIARRDGVIRVVREGRAGMSPPQLRPLCPAPFRPAG
ncbi:MAG: tRNA lysidine(34) synthetase TilS [Alphaproteobacteria bacterium]|nr:tRNA lysidine(34) synthetase TilS [Alphaproteobacteria bacterium]